MYTVQTYKINNITTCTLVISRQKLLEITSLVDKYLNIGKHSIDLLLNKFRENIKKVVAHSKNGRKILMFKSFNSN